MMSEADVLGTAPARPRQKMLRVCAAMSSAGLYGERAKLPLAAVFMPTNM